MGKKFKSELSPFILENNSDLSGLNDDIEQLLKDASKPPTKNHGVPVKRNARGQQIPVAMSRYSTLHDDKTSQTILRKPSLNMSKLPDNFVTISPAQSKRPSIQKASWNQFHDTDESDTDDNDPRKVAFFEESTLQPKEAWSRRRPFTPFRASGFSSDEDEDEEVERCTSPVKSWYLYFKPCRFVEKELCESFCTTENFVLTELQVSILWLQWAFDYTFDMKIIYST